MKRLLTCVALLGLLVGCKEPLPEEPIIPEGKLPINLSLSTTRANDSAYEAGDQIGLYVANYADGVATQLANSGNHVNNMQFTLNDNSWTPATKIYWKDKSTRADFYAYYPYQSTVADVTALPVSVQADQSSEDNYWASDLLWGKTSGVAPTESAVNIATSHALSNLLIYVEPGYGFTAESLAAADVSVEINNVKTAGALNLTNGVVTASGEAATITPWNTGDYYRALIVPQTVAEETTLITVTVDGKAHTIERGFTFLANTQHKFVVRVENDVETKVTLSINPWNEDHNTYGIPDNEIWYTSTDGEIVNPHANATFGANLISNTYVNGRGVMTFDGPVTEIGSSAFSSCSNLETITLPKSVRDSGQFSFNCSNLFQFSGDYASKDGRCLIINGVLEAFARAGLTEYSIPEEVIEIGERAFYDCDSLKSITIPASVKQIDWNAFEYCSNLINVSIPEGVTYISSGAFRCCSSLESITIPESVINIGTAFEGCSSLSQFKGNYASNDGRCLIKDGVLKAFAPAGLTEYSIPDNVTTIPKYVIDGDVESVTIPEGVSEIQSRAFADCLKLSSVYFKSPTPATAITEIINDISVWLPFVGNVLPTLKIYVPASDDDSIINAYKAAEGWSEYADAIEEYEFD